MTWINCKTKLPADGIKVRVLCRAVSERLIGTWGLSRDGLIEMDGEHISNGSGSPLWSIGEGFEYWDDSELVRVEYWHPIPNE